jgi:hypothetical protein
VYPEPQAHVRRATKRVPVEVVREELARYRRVYAAAVELQRVAPGTKPDRRERRYGAIGALERVLEAR